MATQSQIYDEIYAQRSSEFIARQRAANEEYLRRQDKEQSKRQKAIRAIITKAYDTERKIRLHHPSTRRQIGEAVKVHYKSDSILMFELINHPGKMLRVNNTGKVEFAPVKDATAVFELEAMHSGNLYFLCTAYRDLENTLGGKGWYLSMSVQGQLSGSGGKCEASQWLLLEEPAPQPDGVVSPDGTTALPTDSATEERRSNSILASQNNPIMDQADGADRVIAQAYTSSGTGAHNAGADGTFPGVGAGREVLMRYFLTESGVKFLQQPEYSAAYALYLKNGSLSKLLHRPDWPLLANRFVDYTAKPLPVLRKADVDAVLSYSELKAYFEEGFLVARSVVPSELTTAALKLTNYWLSKHMFGPVAAASNSNGSGSSGEGIHRGAGNTIELSGAVAGDCDILALFYASPVVQIVQLLLGAGDVAHPLTARVVTTFPMLELVDPPALFGNQWRIDGFTSTGGHSPYTMLVGVALTDLAEGDLGNVCVHPGSHMSLLEEYQAQVTRKSTVFSDDPAVVNKLDLGTPTQLIMRAGDVFICSQRTAYLHTLNLGPSPTTMVYFRISHIDHGFLKNTALESMWVEYKSAGYYIESADEATAEQLQRTMDARLGRQRHQGAVQKPSAASTVSVAPVPATAAVVHKTNHKLSSAHSPVAVAVPVHTSAAEEATAAHLVPARPIKPATTAPNKSTSRASVGTATPSSKHTASTSAGAGTVSTAGKVKPTTNANTKTATAATSGTTKPASKAAPVKPSPLMKPITTTPVPPNKAAAGTSKLKVTASTEEDEQNKRILSAKQSSLLMDLLSAPPPPPPQPAKPAPATTVPITTDPSALTTAAPSPSILTATASSPVSHGTTANHTVLNVNSTSSEVAQQESAAAAQDSTALVTPTVADKTKPLTPNTLTDDAQRTAPLLPEVPTAPITLPLPPSPSCTASSSSDITADTQCAEKRQLSVA